MVIEGNQPQIYVDGNLKQTNLQKFSKDEPGHTFNIGAGLDYWGYLGYNFKGSISHVLVYDQPLNQKAIESFAKGEIPEGKISMQWVNEK